MIFSSFTFLLLFMPCVLLLYRVLPAGVRMPFLLAASLLFYGWGNPAWLLLIFFSMVLNWGGVLLMTRGGKKPSKAALAGMIVLNLLPLLWFKYAGFLADTWTRLTGIPLDFTAPGLPAGISFFTFQAMSYVIDVYRGQAKPQKNFVTFSVYLSLCRHLVESAYKLLASGLQQISCLRDLGVSVRQYLIRVRRRSSQNCESRQHHRDDREKNSYRSESYAVVHF